MNTPSVAILGDKNISNRGSEITFFAAQELANHRINVVSGYASGADMIAHRSAIVSGGTTTAVIPSGIKFFKPHESNKDQANFDNLLIVSPFFPTVEVNQYNAYIRNRICCALSMAVYIVEAPIDGGIFEAAKSAAKLNIPLYTTRYSSYPENALGNEKIIAEMNGLPISRKSGDVLQPNIDKIIAHAKFDE
jgi:DNA processing protein